MKRKLIKVGLIILLIGLVVEVYGDFLYEFLACKWIMMFGF